MNSLVCDAVHNDISPTSPTEMAHNNDPLVLRLVYDFFQAQFEIKNATFPLISEDFFDLETVQRTDYKRISDVLITQGRLHIEDSRDRIDSQVQTFLDALRLEPPNGLESFYNLSTHFFSGGIDWNLILTYFVFSAELAFHANLRGLATVKDVAQWLVQYTCQHLMPWISENGGWAGIVDFFPQQNESHEEKRNLPKFYGVGAAIGLLSLGLFLSKS